jgi:hypothetical protein
VGYVNWAEQQDPQRVEGSASKVNKNQHLHGNAFDL